ncbi:EF-P lysine aminoacylase EpmA [Alcanivorax quisquiliarum]|uniref:EF-P lysine aminoacylase EpmA n=1 Tax=Alcanivorax quisquiliarum TaxID=2933565 RepID=A0ABT0E6Q8_9GAMM|nr:EF-P lysine aminoacylase EpmA [Alcanivorax quisquiliarum]MCK0537520.1 EF-P lysine aminoacylase EpmA [Alcanivorax quisquiliarum]
MSDWRPGTDARALKARAMLYRQVRAFFDARDVLEVDTPQLASHGVTDIHIQCIAVPGYGYLQSSPEYHMKRLLAAGSGPIWQICRAYRDGEAGRRHNPEFTLLEWYRTGYSLDDLIRECCTLLSELLALSKVQRYAFRELFREVTGLDPLTADTDALRAHAARHTELPALDHAGLVDYLMATEVEAALPPEQLSVVDRFPGWAAALAQTEHDPDGAEVALRFEVYARGMELANGYYELTDTAEQAARFARDQARRAAYQQPPMAPDPYLLAALAHGLPACAGVAVGLDRVLMCQLGESDIRRLITFPHHNA